MQQSWRSISNNLTKHKENIFTFQKILILWERVSIFTEHTPSMGWWHHFGVQSSIVGYERGSM